MSNFRIPVFLIPVAAVVAVGLLFLLFADSLFNLDFGLIVDRSTASSSIVALAGRDLMRLNTLEAVYKIVFPHDFFPSDLEWRPFLRRVDSGADLSIDEVRWLEVYQLADSVGIDLTSRDNEFVVVTVTAKLGFDLDSFAEETRNVANAAVGPVSVRSDGSVVVSTPHVSVTDLIIDDSERQAYPYPDVGMSPDGWRRITDYVARSVPGRLEAASLFEEAEAAGRRFLTGFFNQAGYETVYFAE